MKDRLYEGFKKYSKKYIYMSSLFKLLMFS